MANISPHLLFFGTVVKDCESYTFRDPAVESRTIADDSGVKSLGMPESPHSARPMSTMSPSIRLAKSQDGGVLLDVEQGAMFSLNPVGARIIELLREGHDQLSLVGTISREFHVSPETVREDVAGFLRTLREQHLLTDAEAASRSHNGDAR
jgi:hypothetical protein